MFAYKDNSIPNEPLLARHARFMHGLASRRFRERTMGEFDQAHAAAVLRPSHVRRAMDVESAPKGAVIRELFIEEMRRQINMILVGRFSKMMVIVYAALLAAVIAVYGVLWTQTEAMRVAYVQDRGYQTLSKGQAVVGAAKNKAAGISEGAKEKAAASKEKLAEYMKARSERKAAEGGELPPQTMQPTKTDGAKERMGAWLKLKAEQAKAAKKEFDQAGEKERREPEALPN